MIRTGSRKPRPQQTLADPLHSTVSFLSASKKDPSQLQRGSVLLTAHMQKPKSLSSVNAVHLNPSPHPAYLHLMPWSGKTQVTQRAGSNVKCKRDQPIK